MLKYKRGGQQKIGEMYSNRRKNVALSRQVLSELDGLKNNPDLTHVFVSFDRGARMTARDAGLDVLEVG